MTFVDVRVLTLRLDQGKCSTFVFFSLLGSKWKVNCCHEEEKGKEKRNGRGMRRKFIFSHVCTLLA